MKEVNFLCNLTKILGFLQTVIFVFTPFNPFTTKNKTLGEIEFIEAYVNIGA